MKCNNNNSVRKQTILFYNLLTKRPILLLNYVIKWKNDINNNKNVRIDHQNQYQNKSRDSR